MSIASSPDQAGAAGRSVRGAAPLYGWVYATFMAASGAPSPLYRVYQEAWRFSPALLTTIFGVYAVSLLVALLTVGSLSDHLGRRPVILAALIAEVVALACFAGATGPGWLIVARIVQGFATGAATGALTAGIVDGDPRRAALVNGLSPLLGMAAGTLGCSVLIDVAPAPLRLVYLLLLAALAVQIALVAMAPETGRRRAGALASLRPRLRVARASRADLWRAAPMSLAVWALGGFYLSLMPSVVRAVTGSTLALTGGAVVAALMVAGAAGLLAARSQAAGRIIAVTSLLLVLGVAVTLDGILSGSVPVMLAGTLLSGLGFGAGFLGALKTALTSLRPDDRAGLMSGLYVLSYAAFSGPAMLAGVAVRAVGLVPTAVGYGAGVILLALVALAAILGRESPAPTSAVTDRSSGPELPMDKTRPVRH